MALKDDMIRIINTLFERNKINIRLKEMLFFRPVVREPPFEHMEIIDDAKRVLYCNPICTVFLMTVDNRRLEYETEYQNDDGELAITSYRLRYCDYFPNEDPKKIENNMDQTVRFVLLVISAILKVLASEELGD